MSRLLSITNHFLYLVLAIASSVYHFAPTTAQAMQCKQLFQSETGQKKSTREQFMEAGIFLKQNRSKIDAHRTHIDQLLPFIEQITDGIYRSLSSKKDLPLYQERSPILKNILSEIEERIHSKKVTYAWYIALGFRVSFFSEMSDVVNSTNTSVLHTDELNPKYYLTHEGFIDAVVNSLIEARLDKSEDRVVYAEAGPLHSYHYILTSLKTKGYVFLPNYSSIGYETMNRLWAEDIYALSIIHKPFFGVLDDINFTEFIHFYHDYTHAELDQIFLGDQYNFAREKRKSLEKKVLNRLLSLKTTSEESEQYKALHMLHFLIFHEKAFTWHLPKEKDPRSELFHLAFTELEQQINDLVSDEMSRKQVLGPIWRQLNPAQLKTELEKSLQLFKDIFKQSIKEINF